MTAPLSHTLTFGYRSLLFRLAITIIAYVIMLFLFGIPGFLLAFLMSIFLNLDAIDTMKITLDDKLLHVTRYVPLTQYDCKFWLKDIKEAGIYLKIKGGKSRRPDGGRSGSIQSWYQLHVILNDGSEQEIMLLGMLAFERKQLKEALEAKGIPSFEILYRMKDGGTLNP